MSVYRKDSEIGAKLALGSGAPIGAGLGTGFASLFGFIRKAADSLPGPTFMSSMPAPSLSWISRN